MTPSPMRPRSLSRSLGWFFQSQMWKEKSFFLAAAAGDVGLEMVVPPDVEDVDGDAEVIVGEADGHVEGLAHGVDGAAAVGVHGVERLDAELDAAGAGVAQDGAEAVGDLRARGEEGLAGCGAADHDDELGAERGGLVDHAQVVVDGFLALGGVERGEESAADVGDDLEAFIAAELPGGLDAVGVFLRGVTPDGDACYSGGGVLLRGGGEGQGLVVTVWRQRRDRSLMGDAGINYTLRETESLGHRQHGKKTNFGQEGAAKSAPANLVPRGEITAW